MSDHTAIVVLGALVGGLVLIVVYLLVLTQVLVTIVRWQNHDLTILCELVGAHIRGPHAAGADDIDVNRRERRSALLAHLSRRANDK